MKNICFMFSNSLLLIGCSPQIKQFTSVAHHYVNNVFAITVKITFMMPYHGFIVYFKLKRFARFDIPTSVINTIITGKTSKLVNTRKLNLIKYFCKSNLLYLMWLEKQKQETSCHKLLFFLLSILKIYYLLLSVLKVFK